MPKGTIGKYFDCRKNTSFFENSKSSVQKAISVCQKSAINQLFAIFFILFLHQSKATPT